MIKRIPWAGLGSVSIHLLCPLIASMSTFWMFAMPVVGIPMLGLALYQLRKHQKDCCEGDTPRTRIELALVIAAVLALGYMTYTHYLPSLNSSNPASGNLHLHH